MRSFDTDTQAEPSPQDVVLDYAAAVRRSACEPMGPAGFTPHWINRPPAHKTYPEAARFDFPPRPLRSARTVADALAATPEQAPEEWTWESLGELLRWSVGPLARRLRVTANKHQNSPYPTTDWARGVASGGGLYPQEIYWITGQGGSLRPGIYHYSPPAHGMHRLLLGDLTSRVHAALPDSTDAAEFLVVSTRFWRNSFKYANFSLHCVTLDIGCLLAGWQCWLRAHGSDVSAALWFDGQMLDELLGLCTETESVMAVLPLPRHLSRPAPAATGARVTTPSGESTPAMRFPLVEDAHLAMMAGGSPPPTRDYPQRPARSALTRSLPRHTTKHGAVSLERALAARRSSFGLLRSTPALPVSELGALLDMVGAAGLRTDLAPDTAGLLRIAVLVNHVHGVPRAMYDYDRTQHSLNTLTQAPSPTRLQRRYRLDNYNLEQAAAILMVIARPVAVVTEIGGPGYRLVNAAVGAFAQRTYLAASALGLGCGAALAFDAEALAEDLRLREPDTVLLLLMVGHERRDQADLRYSLVEPP